MAASPHLALDFEQAGQRYVLTNRGRLFVQALTADPEADRWPEVTSQVMAQRILFTELAKYLVTKEEPEP